MIEMPALPSSPEIERFNLANGMDVVLCHMPWLHRTGMLLNVKSGCRDEHLPGTAHMLEHLMFRGTARYPSLGALSQAFEELGADFNAYTAREVTCFDVVMPPESSTGVIRLLGDVMSTPKLTGISAERDIIREEILGDYDADGTLINVDDFITELFYGEAGRPIAGNPEDLDKITKQEVLAFYEAHYAAQNMMLVVAGDMPKDIRRTLDDAFSQLKTRPTPWRRRAMQAHDTTPRLAVQRYDGATQSEALFGFLTDAPGGRDFLPLEMLVRIMDDGMASRLSARLVEKLALVYDAESYLGSTSDSTLMQVRFSCRHSRVARISGEVYNLIRELAETDVPADELDRVRRRVIWEHTGMLDGAASFAQWISTMILQNLPYDVSVRCNELLNITHKDIRDVSAKMLTTMPHIVAIVGDVGERAEETIRASMRSGLKGYRSAF